jgi:hypothetical protein
MSLAIALSLGLASDANVGMQAPVWAPESRKTCWHASCAAHACVSSQYAQQRKVPFGNEVSTQVRPCAHPVIAGSGLHGSPFPPPPAERHRSSGDQQVSSAGQANVSSRHVGKIPESDGKTESSHAFALVTAQPTNDVRIAKRSQRMI